MKKLLSIIFLFILILTNTNLIVYSQYNFNCQIENYPNNKIIFCQQFGDESKIIKKLFSDNQGNFYCSLDSLACGLYRIYLSDDSYFDFIFNNENIKIHCDKNNIVNTMEIIESEENKEFYKFLKSNYIFDYKIEILEQFIDIYPQGNLLETAKKEYNEIIKAKKNNITNFTNKKNTFCSKYITCFEEYNLNNIISINEKKKFIVENFWKNKILNDTILLNSDMYNQYIIYYIKLRTKNSFANNIYYQVAKEILNNFENSDKKIFDFVLDYILSGYEAMELNKEVETLSSEYFETCNNEDDDDNTLNTRLKYYNLLKIGSNAINFSATTILGDTINFSKPLTKKTLLIFWASWCEHCQQMLPEIEKEKKLFKEKNIDIITISLDKDKNNLLNFLKKNNFNFDIICDFKSWENEIVKDYYIFGTPIMLLIDENFKIIAKPYNEEQLFRLLKN